jgi:ADP-ribose pyrophosphatase YjhB (NUDIX family)
MSNKYPLSEEEFWAIYKKVPRLTVEVVMLSNEGVLLTLRDIEPCKGLWHLPGGTVYFGEKLSDAIKRIAKRELNIRVKDAKLLGYIEYPSHYENGLDHPVGLAFKVLDWVGEIRPNIEAKNYAWFKKLPPNMHGDQSDFLKPYLS